MMNSEIMPPQSGAPKVQEATKTKAPELRLNRTTSAIKKQKPLPTFQAGELFPLKGVWFKLIGIQDGRLILEATKS